MHLMHTWRIWDCVKKTSIRKIDKSHNCRTFNPRSATSGMKVHRRSLHHGTGMAVWKTQELLVRTMQYLYDGMMSCARYYVWEKNVVSLGPVANKWRLFKQLKTILMLIVMKFERGFNIEVQCSIWCVLSSIVNTAVQAGLLYTIRGTLGYNPQQAYLVFQTQFGRFAAQPVAAKAILEQIRTLRAAFKY